jgi:hypothetical protein
MKKLKLTKEQRDKLPVDVGYVPENVRIIEAIHAIQTRNFTFYREQALRGAVHTWVKPYNKPLIRNHDTDTEALGRITGAVVTQSVQNPEYTTTRTYVEILDKEAEAKFEDGRYKTVSIGSAVDSARCSICDKDILKEDFCGHWRGRKYDGKTCTWSIESIMSHDELSVVNVPSDQLAADVTDLVLKGEVKESVNKHEMTEAETLAALSAIEEALVVSIVDESTPDETPSELPGLEENTPDNKDNDLEKIVSELAEATGVVTTLQGQLSEASAALEQAKVDILQLQDALEVRSAETQQLHVELANQKNAVAESGKQNVVLAKFAVEAYKKLAAVLTVFAGEAGSHEEALIRFESTKLAELKIFVDESLARTPLRPEQRIADPTGQESESTPIEPTVADMVDVLTKFMSRKR